MKHYFLVSLLSSPLGPLTYECEYELKIGNIVEVTLNKKSRIGVVISKTVKPDFECEEIISVKEEFYEEKTLMLAKFISDYYVCSLGDAIKLFVPYKKVQIQYKNSEKAISPFILSKKQESAFEFINHHDRSLLFGDTGSGKTEIYMKCITEVINSGKKAIFLMPEIGLTPQMKKRLVSVFGERVAIWHSKITKKKKEEIINDLCSDKISLIAGTRSALFLPVSNLGLIIVDEEHDDSYKSSQRPRYNAKDLALLFAKRENAKVVLGSATPSLGSYKNLPRFRLSGTYFDTKKSYFFENYISELTPLLIDKIKEHLDKKEKIIVFLPTRANFKYMTCFDCGANITCPHCSVGMSLHSDKNALVCHYCNFTQRIPNTCPKCESENLHTNRIGTAQIVAYLKEVFKDKVIGKFDRDEVKTIKKLNSVLKDFNDGLIDILVGTQMLSKGHDYHSIGLSVIMGIDAVLNMPDFRAREKAISLVHQIAGRAGRAGEGEVYIQTQNVDIIKEFMSDYESFLKDELRYRKEIYPPFIKLLKILVSHKSDEKASLLLAEVVRLARTFSKLEIVGEGRANIEKIAGKYRYNLLLRSHDPKELLNFAHTCNKLQVEIDMDPLSFS
ncbi:MAG: primosomal protein N' [Sulfurospirillaceae bacterium]|nr:primosomal protein N' [Sulfurospirillaceae bacterium]